MDELNQKIIHLLTNVDFRKWVTEPNDERDMYWQKWLQSHPESNEAMIKAKEIIIRLRFKQDALSDTEQETILDKIIAVPAHHDKYKSGVELVYWLKIAAVITVVVSIGYLFYSNTPSVTLHTQDTYSEHTAVVEKKNPQGVKSQFVLPDGTKVFLNAESELIFSPNFSDTARVVELTGEAFFEVAHDHSRPFIVRSKNIVTTALGTSFNVRAFPSDKKVNIALVTGKVQINADDTAKSNYHLNPGEKITLDLQQDRVFVTNFNMLTETGWKDGILILENAGFSEFVAKIERWYGVKVKIIGQPKTTWNIDGHFNNESLEEILKGVSFTHDVDYKINKKEVEIKFDY